MPTFDYIPHDALTILTRLITTAIDRGYVISVNDGEGWAVKSSTDRSAILGAINSVEESSIRLRHRDTGESIGSVVIVPSNCDDVLCDWTDTPEMNVLIEPLL